MPTANEEKKKKIRETLSGFTNEQLRKLADKEWRVANLYKITDKNQKLVTFKPNQAQLHYRANKHTRNIILKSRQLGFTTHECIDMLDDAIFKQNYNGAIIAQTKDDAIDFFDRKIKLAWEHFPFAFTYETDTDRANMLKIGHKLPLTQRNPKGKNMVYSSMAVKVSGRSGTYNRLHVSEFGIICKDDPLRAEEIISGAIPTVPMDGQVTIESTAEEAIGFFADMFWAAWNRPAGQELRPTDFKAHFYNWQWDKEEIAKVGTPIPKDQLPKRFQDYQIEHGLTDLEITYYFLKWESLGKNDYIMKKQYPTTPEEAFAAAGTPFFSPASLERQKPNLREPASIRGAWKFYEEYKPNHSYAMAADPSEGVGGDPATAVVMDFSYPKPRVVATFNNNHTSPDILAYECMTVGRQYGFCLIAPERNNHGHAMISKLKDIYPIHLIYTEIKESKKEDVVTDTLGWLTNLVTKPRMLFELNTALNEDLIEITDKDMLTQLATYPNEDVNKNKKKAGEHHWDLVIALAICFQMKNHSMVNTGGAVQTYSGAGRASTVSGGGGFDPFEAI